VKSSQACREGAYPPPGLSRLVGLPANVCTGRSWNAPGAAWKFLDGSPLPGVAVVVMVAVMMMMMVMAARGRGVAAPAASSRAAAPAMAAAAHAMAAATAHRTAKAAMTAAAMAATACLGNGGKRKARGCRNCTDTQK
jgi:hypothetical protein